MKTKSFPFVTLALVVALGLGAGLMICRAHAIKPPPTGESTELKTLEYEFSVITATGAAAAFVLGLRQYRRAEQWKRTEFLAGAIEKFHADPKIRNALTMIDWAPRPINLYHDSSHDPAKHILVSRELQLSALQHHSNLVGKATEGANAEPAGADAAEAARQGAHTLHRSNGQIRKSRYTYDEAEIRDAYDRLLDQFERFGDYLEAGIVTLSELKPHLGYWIEDIASETKDPRDAAWTCALFDYIDAYGYEKVQSLFLAFKRDIRPCPDGKSGLYRTLREVPGVEVLLEDAKWVWPSPPNSAGASARSTT